MAPDRPDYTQAAGELTAELGSLEAAAERMQHAVDARPDAVDWQDALGQVLGELGQWAAAVGAFKSASQSAPDPGRKPFRFGE